MSESTKMITVESYDHQTFEVEEYVALQSQTIKHMIEDDCANTTIPLPNIKTGALLAKVIEYMKKHAQKKDAADTAYGNDKDAEKELEAFDKEFVNVDDDTVFDLILAANYLDIKSLLDLTCQTIADLIKGKTPEQIRERFFIKNDYTPEEEEEVRRENAWAFE